MDVITNDLDQTNVTMSGASFLGKGDPGEPGEPGADGVSVVRLYISNGHLYCELSDETVIDAGAFPTPAHYNLSGLDVSNQHPISAIAGLSEALSDKVTIAMFNLLSQGLEAALFAVSEQKQDITDNTLTTTDKTVPGAINELKSSQVVIYDSSPSSTKVYSSEKVENELYGKTDATDFAEFAETMYQALGIISGVIPEDTTTSNKLVNEDGISGKLNISQGAAHAGEFMVVGADGNITTRSLSTWQGGNY